MKLKISLSVFFLVFAVIGLSFFSYQFGQVQPWLNMTEREAWDQSARAIGENARACEVQGGVWVVGFADAYCSVVYMTPGLSGWWVQPEENPGYRSAQGKETIFTILSLMTGAFAFVWVMTIWFSPNHNPFPK